MLEKQFKAEEIQGKINKKTTRYIKLAVMEVDKPIVRARKLKEAPFA